MAGKLIGNCFECGKPLAADGDKGHTFAAYEFYAEYCAACCPGEVDGTECSVCDSKCKRCGKVIPGSLAALCENCVDDLEGDEPSDDADAMTWI